jgi:hypothetical protein
VARSEASAPQGKAEKRGSAEAREEQGEQEPTAVKQQRRAAAKAWRGQERAVDAEQYGATVKEQREQEPTAVKQQRRAAWMEQHEKEPTAGRPIAVKVTSQQAQRPCAPRAPSVAEKPTSPPRLGPRR